MLAYHNTGGVNSFAANPTHPAVTVADSPSDDSPVEAPASPTIPGLNHPARKLSVRIGFVGTTPHEVQVPAGTTLGHLAQAEAALAGQPLSSAFDIMGGKNWETGILGHPSVHCWLLWFFCCCSMFHLYL